MAVKENTVTGTAQVKLNISADYDLDPTGIDSDLVANFTKDLNVGTLKNMKKFEGTITPADDLQDLAVFDGTEAVKLVIVFFSGKMGLRVILSSPTLSDIVTIDQSLVRHKAVYYDAYKGDYYLGKIQADTRTATFADPADLDQNVEINYAIFTFEEE